MMALEKDEPKEKAPFAKLLDAMVAKKAAENTKTGKEEDLEDLNILPLPDEQVIGDGYLEWRWMLDEHVVSAKLSVRVPNKMGLDSGNYKVELMKVYEDVSDDIGGTYAKALGQALISAWNWQRVWKDHAGELLLKAMSNVVNVDGSPAVPEGMIDGADGADGTDGADGVDDADRLVGQP